MEINGNSLRWHRFQNERKKFCGVFTLDRQLDVGARSQAKVLRSIIHLNSYAHVFMSNIIYNNPTYYLGKSIVNGTSIQSVSGGESS